MQLIFTKGPGKHDWLDVIRDGQPAARIECPKQGIIPHDMVHFAVEQTLHRRGFLSRVLDGEAAGFQMEAAAESDAVERLVEVFQADGWSGWCSLPADMLDLYRLTCAARQCPPLRLDTADIDAVREHLLALTGQWQASAIGDRLTLRFERAPDAT